MRRRAAVALSAAVGVVVLVAPSAASAKEVDCGDYPKPTNYVVDQANAVSAAVERDLDAALASFESSSGGSQVAALVVDSIGDRGIEDYANDVFGCWGVGKKGDDTGVLLVVALEQRRMRIEVGRGLEGDLTDVESADIIREDITPAFKAGDISGGVANGVQGIVRALGGDVVRPVAQQPQQPPIGGSGGPELACFVLIAVIALVSMLGRARRGGRGGGFFPPIIMGGGWGGSGYGGGGFGGGGGGGGFGGFGGGGSGGGGASGGW
jgi:uncharacterized protein